MAFEVKLSNGSKPVFPIDHKRSYWTMKIIHKTLSGRHVGYRRAQYWDRILFLVFINDFPDHTRSNVRLLADDKPVSLDAASTRLGRVEKLVFVMRHGIQSQQVYRTVIHVTRSKTAVLSQYTLYSHIMEAVSSSWNLINDHLTWNVRIQNAVTSANRTLSFIKRKLLTKTHRWGSLPSLCASCIRFLLPLAIVQRFRLSVDITMLPGMESFRLTVSSLLFSMP